MKKLMIIASLFSIIVLSGCGTIRKKILAPPDEVQLPEGSLLATCEKNDAVYKHIYKEDGVYQYVIDDVIQNEEVLDTILEQAFLHGQSVENYLVDEYGVNGCIIEEISAFIEE